MEGSFFRLARRENRHGPVDFRICEGSEPVCGVEADCCGAQERCWKRETSVRDGEGEAIVRTASSMGIEAAGFDDEDGSCTERVVARGAEARGWTNEVPTQRDERRVTGDGGCCPAVAVLGCDGPARDFGRAEPVGGVEGHDSSGVVRPIGGSAHVLASPDASCVHRAGRRAREARLLVLDAEPHTVQGPLWIGRRRGWGTRDRSEPARRYGNCSRLPVIASVAGPTPSGPRTLTSWPDVVSAEASRTATSRACMPGPERRMRIRGVAVGPSSVRWVSLRSCWRAFFSK